MTTVHIPGAGEFTEAAEGWQEGEWTAFLSVGLLGEDREFVILDDEPSRDAERIAEFLSNFRGLAPSALDDLAPRIYDNYREVIGLFDADEREGYGIPEITGPSDVLDFVEIGYPHLEKDNRTDEWFIVLENECEWEPEHGLQIVLRNGEEVTRVSQVDGFLRSDPEVSHSPSTSKMSATPVRM
ncbi:hypothetical protein [Corynebacterium glyciniphilum]|uniref:DUF6985 domain-containing protein n=1 Tax=Corynebacterium glyciniphilum TaxID=1404244 RepID=UPI0026544F85|nr:hypothetical protein [Corynebacterium glyciniphilum]MDN5682810.1 hypothetical protein [Corynebacterium glyciniphilum]MDN6706883.1 hypothetical protein [Corynebacterium glyciniphilum]